MKINMAATSVTGVGGNYSGAGSPAAPMTLGVSHLVGNNWIDKLPPKMAETIKSLALKWDKTHDEAILDLIRVGLEQSTKKHRSIDDD